MNRSIMGSPECPVKAGKERRVVKLLASLDEYGVYWDECDPDMAQAQDFLNRLRSNERLSKACMRVKRLNTTIELERKFKMGSSWAKINTYAPIEKITGFLNSLR
jgi:hypothetical protein